MSRVSDEAYDRALARQWSATTREKLSSGDVHYPMKMFPYVTLSEAQIEQEQIDREFSFQARYEALVKAAKAVVENSEFCDSIGLVDVDAVSIAELREALEAVKA